MRLVLVGPPGSGKGTQAEKLVKQLGLTYVGTGEILRAAIRSGTPMGRRVEPLMKQGLLVPDPEVNDVVAELFRSERRPDCFVMDGYPRTYSQAVAFDALLRQQFLAIDAVVNLTPPKVHGAVTRAALEGGHSVFSEKPLSIDFEEGRELVRLAVERGVRLGCAPDSFLGAGLQTARAVIDRGDIGEPVAANAVMLGCGPEWWHPDPKMFLPRYPPAYASSMARSSTCCTWKNSPRM